jgi:hypothetical protein
MADIFFLEEISNESVNPYEAVKVASMEARRINQSRNLAEIKVEGEKATTLGLRRLSQKKIQPTYDPGSSAG